MDRLSAELLCLGVVLRIVGLPFVSHDATESTIPWYENLSQRGFAVLATDFSNYNPPYLYLVWLAALAFGPLHPLLGIKCLGFVCDIGLCAAVAQLVMRIDPSSVSFPRAFSVTWCVPTIVVNSAVWGQCDGLYSAFVVSALAATCASRPALAFGSFGIALGLKLQAIFAAPVFALLLLTRRMPWRAVPISAACFLVLLIPAALAGRPWADLLTIYSRQTEAFLGLAHSAPNIWSALKRVVPTDSFRTWTNVALLCAGLAAIAYLILGSRRLVKSNTGEPRPERPSRNTVQHLGTPVGTLPMTGMLLEAAFVGAFVLPYLLPKMHDRYFFLADVLAVALALVDRRWLKVAVLVQIGSLTAYAPFLLGLRWPLAFGVASNTVVFAALVLRWCPPLRLFVDSRGAGAPTALRPKQWARPKDRVQGRAEDEEKNAQAALLGRLALRFRDTVRRLTEF